MNVVAGTKSTVPVPPPPLAAAASPFTHISLKMHYFEVCSPAAVQGDDRREKMERIYALEYQNGEGSTLHPQKAGEGRVHRDFVAVTYSLTII